MDFFHIDSVIMGLAVFSTAIFIGQTILTFFVGLDSDADFDMGDVDGGGMDVSDMVSFKGLIHFLLGFSWTGTINGFETFSQITVSVIVGLIFVAGLAYLYKKMLSLAEIVTHQKPEEAIGQKTEIIHYYKGIGKAFIVLDGAKKEVNIKGNDTMKRGDYVIIKDYKDNMYIVESAKEIEQQSLKDYERLKSAADKVLRSAKSGMQEKPIDNTDIEKI